jgi:translocator protein
MGEFEGRMCPAPMIAMYILRLIPPSFEAVFRLSQAWTWLFFGHHRIGGALMDIIVLWVAILATLITFWKLELVAGLMLTPYLAWVSFATVLNWTIRRMNR